jgi:hypothetical protein
MKLTPYHAKYYAYELTRRCPPDSDDRLAGALVDARVDLNPHQIEAALFTFRSPLSRGVLLADEVGLGKTIEAGLVLAQKWAERRRRVLVITPANLRKQWHQELSDKFFLPCRILESRSYNEAIKQGRFRPFEPDGEIVICSYQFARAKAASWDMVVMDEAHRLRNVYKPSNVIANTLKQALAPFPKLLLTATPLQNSLLELYGLVSIIDDQVFGDGRSFREQFADPYANKPYSRGTYSIIGPTGRTFAPPPGRYWRISEDKLRALDEAGRIWWGPRKDARPSIKRYLSEVGDLVPRTLWGKKDVGSNRTSKNEMRALFPGDTSFGTPKPERLIERVLALSTKPDDLVLDSFAGSGTTGAVCQKTGRRWIMIELGEHAHSYIVPRLKQVIDGRDAGGVTEMTDWQGGGGFRFYRLAPSLLERDKWGNWVINKAYDAAMLSEALCKLEGFTYAPSDTVFWQHGHSTERDFIYVTTHQLTQAQFQQISDEVGPERSLLIMCTAFRGRPEEFANLTVKRIPKAVLSRCEWGRDDYSLEVANLPPAPPPPGQQELALAD